MIDLHMHILPDVDDGPPNLEEALNILQAAADDGTKAAAATPHIFSPVGRIKNIEELPERMAILIRAAQERQIPIEVLTGAEVFFVSDLRERLRRYRDILTLNGSDYFLLEFPGGFVFPGTEEVIFDLAGDGLLPVICHPERNYVFQHNHGLLYNLIRAGALVQVDAGSLQGRFGPTASSAALKFLKYNMVHLVASDAHDTELRKPGLSFLYRKLSHLGKERVDMLLETVPLAIVNNTPIPDTGPVVEPGKEPKFFDFIKGIFK